MRTTNERGGPGAPSMSRDAHRHDRVADREAERLGDDGAELRRAALRVTTKWDSPSSNSVHASSGPRPPGTPEPSTKRQPKSLIAFEIGCVALKLVDAGTPPIIGGISSHTAALPSPSGRETMISKSGRTFGSDWSKRNVLRPTRLPARAGLRLDDDVEQIAERALVDRPALRSVVPTGSMMLSSAPRQADVGDVGAGPRRRRRRAGLLGVRVIVGVSVIVGVRVAVPVRVGVRVIVRVRVGVPVLVVVPVRVIVPVRGRRAGTGAAYA